MLHELQKKNQSQQELCHLRQSELSEEKSKQSVGLNTFVLDEALVNYLFKEEQ